MALTLGALGCAPSNGAPPRENMAPRVIALSRYTASVGNTVTAYVKNLPAPSKGVVTLHFRGKYSRSDGSIGSVNLVTQTKRIDQSTVRWTDFGPFSNPFDAETNMIGTFNGTVSPRVILSTGKVVEGPATTLRFKVLPSIVIEQFEPTTADCGGYPAKRAFGGQSYRVRARAIGFVPAGFAYTLQVPKIESSVSPDDNLVHAKLLRKQDGSPDWTIATLVHLTSSDRDVADGADAVKLPPVPDELRAYNMMLSVDALDAAGHDVRANLIMRTQQAVDFSSEGAYQLAELEEPRPVSTCMPGGAVGRWANYTDTSIETAARNLSFTLSQSWMNSISKGSSTTLNNSWSTSDGQTYSQTVRDTSGWSSSDTDSTSNTKSRTDTTASSTTKTGTTETGTAQSQAKNSSNSFTFNLEGQHVDGQTLKLSQKDSSDHSQDSGFAVALSLKLSPSIKVKPENADPEVAVADEVEQAIGDSDLKEAEQQADDGVDPVMDDTSASPDTTPEQEAWQVQQADDVNGPQIGPADPTPGGPADPGENPGASGVPGQDPPGIQGDPGAADNAKIADPATEQSKTQGIKKTPLHFTGIGAPNEFCPGGPCAILSRTSTDTSKHSDKTSTSEDHYDSNGWAVGSTSTQGESNEQSSEQSVAQSSSSTKSSATSTGSSSTETTTRQSANFGYRASTDGATALNVETEGGATSATTADGTVNSESAQQDMSTGWQVSSQHSIGTSFKGLIVANTYGVFFRQRARYEHRAVVNVYDKCGNGQPIGVAALQDYVWAVDLATGPACPPMPRTAFPPAQCYLPPCDTDGSQ
jgi:hypothetical protein